jgi:NTE family protein
MAARDTQHDESTLNEARVLVLQGGGALGSYQAGVVEALEDAGLPLDWVAGISIGAINAAIIVGNPPGRRVERLKSFWETITAGVPFSPTVPGDKLRSAFNEMSAAWGAMIGVPGFFAPRFPPAPFNPPGTPEAISYYDTSALRQTLLAHADFDLINAGTTRLSVGAVNVRTGNFAYFDSHRETITPEHIMASGALPPGFPPVEIKGELYWDGGLVSNTPLEYVVDHERTRDLIIVQIDLFPARGPAPKTLGDVTEREKDIRFSSRTRLNTDAAMEIHKAKTAYRRLAKKLPPELRDDPDAAFLAQTSHENAVTILQMIYRRKSYESGAKDYEFSRKTMLEHWAAGVDDVRRSLAKRAWIERCRPTEGVSVLDLTRDEET